ncbi:Phosphate transporter PHO1 like protein 7 [Astathelohania contejeani]|uniref:Phosphate transporter PHO1 like protein 7 n=1 Tax=Astathelohania contejeani TaxID=164912 RepID=A0ABQ7I0S0_9MICR|nr:Phosphate transporter PHO1 like protein 7 [Thelohania contejeani]
MLFLETLKENRIGEWKDEYIAYKKLKFVLKTERKEFIKEVMKEIMRVNEFFVSLEAKAREDKVILFRNIKKHRNIPECLKEIFDENALSDKKDDKKDDIKESIVIDNGEVKDEINDRIIPQTDEDESSNKCNTVADQSTSEEKNMSRSETRNSGIKHIFKRGARQFLNQFNIKERISWKSQENSIINFLALLNSIERYRDLNLTGFRKILKKYDKKYGENTLEKLYPVVDSSYFSSSVHVPELVNQARVVYKVLFAKNPAMAKRAFKRIEVGAKGNHVASFFAGVFLTTSYILWDSIDLSSTKKYQFFYFLFYPLLSALIFGLTMELLKRKSINYSHILKLNPLVKTGLSQYFLLITALLILHTGGVYIVSKYNVLSFGYIFLLISAIVVCPFNIFYKDSRYFFVGTFCECLFAPFFEVKFRHFLIADCVLSCSYSIVLGYKYFFGDPGWFRLFLITFFPLHIRVLQCLRRYYDTWDMFPHLFNCLKYLLSVTFTFISIYSNEYPSKFSNSSKIVIGIINSTYSSAWDIIVDYAIDRQERIFPYPVYYILPLYNIFGRFAWTLCYFFNNIPHQLAVIEIIRRYFWALMRIEVEHLNNQDKLKEIRHRIAGNGDLFYQKDIPEITEADEEIV